MLQSLPPRDTVMTWGLLPHLLPPPLPPRRGKHWWFLPSFSGWNGGWRGGRQGGDESRLWPVVVLPQGRDFMCVNVSSFSRAFTTCKDASADQNYRDSLMTWEQWMLLVVGYVKIWILGFNTFHLQTVYKVFHWVVDYVVSWHSCKEDQRGT